MAGAPTVDLEMDWQGGMRFHGRCGPLEVDLDGDAQAGPSPVQAAAFGLASCMASDLVHILTRGRWELAGLGVRLHAERAPADPRRFVRIDLHFEVRGQVPGDKVERALALSREKYCSVWQSFRQDIPFTTTFAVTPPGPAPEA
jgi:putative redox protein